MASRSVEEPLGNPDPLTVQGQENVVIRLLLCYILQKGPGEEVIADVSSTEDQVSSRSSQLSRLCSDLAVLYNLGDALDLADHPQRLCRVGLLHHLTHSN